MGSLAFPGIGTAIGISFGGAIGGLLGGYLAKEKIDTNFAPPPKANEQRLATFGFGQAIPRVFGTAHRMAPQALLWMSPVVESYVVDHEHGDVDYDVHTKSYTASFALAFCEGPVDGISRIWLDNELLVDFRDPNGTFYPTGSGYTGTVNYDASLGRQTAQYTVYYGTESQTADPTIVSYEGSANTQAYRGICYVVFTDFNVGETAGLPAVEVEIVVAGSTSESRAYIDLDDVGYGYNMLTASHPWTTDGHYVLCDYLNHRFIIMNRFTEEVLSTFTVPKVVTISTANARISGWGVNPYNGQLWVCVVDWVALSQYYRRDLRYSAPGGTLLYDNEYIVNVGVGPYAWKATNYHFFSTAGVWERYETLYSGWQTYYGLRQIDTNFATIGTNGLANFRIYKSDGSYGNSVYGIKGKLSNDATHFYYQTIGTEQNIGYGTVNVIIKFTPASLYIYSGSYPTASMAVPWGWAHVKTSPTQFPAQWSNGVNFPSTIWADPIGESPYWTNKWIDLYLTPSAPEAYMREYITEESVSLDAVVEEICEMAGLVAGDEIDVSALTGSDVLGYVITRQMPARQALEPLMVAYHLDCGEVDWKLKFSQRGGSSADTILSTELAAREFGSARADRVTETIDQAIEVPATLSFFYISKGRDYDKGVATSYRCHRTDLTTHQSIEVPVIMTDTQAKQTVEIAHKILDQTRHKYRFQTSMEHVRLSPTDLVTVCGKLMRITGVSYDLPVLVFQAEAEEGGRLDN